MQRRRHKEQASRRRITPNKHCDKILTNCLLPTSQQRATYTRLKQRGDNLQVVAFDSAGCPAYKTKLELDAWIKNAREMEAADGADLLSFTELRARIVRELVRAQASALLRIRCEAINLV